MTLPRLWKRAGSDLPALDTHFLKLPAKLLDDQECVVVSKRIYVSRKNIWNGSTIDLGTCKVVPQKCVFLRTANVILPGIGRISTCNTSWNYCLCNSRLTLGTVSCCLSLKLLKQFWIEIVHQYFEISSALKKAQTTQFMHISLLPVYSSNP